LQKVVWERRNPCLKLLNTRHSIRKSIRHGVPSLQGTKKGRKQVLEPERRIGRQAVISCRGKKTVKAKPKSARTGKLQRLKLIALTIWGACTGYGCCRNVRVKWRELSLLPRGVSCGRVADIAIRGDKGITIPPRKNPKKRRETT